MCCTGLLKILMFIFNGGIFLAGAVLLGVGVWLKVDSSSLFGFLENIENAPPELSQLASVSYLLIGVGAVLLVIGFLGCCGAIRESRCMLLTFFSIVLIIFIIEVAGAVVMFVFQDVAEELLDKVEDEITKSIEDNYGKNDSVTTFWDTTMEQFKCCGFRNYTDFDGSPFNQGNLYPAPCCNSTIPANACSEPQAMLSRKDGCYDKLLKLIEDNALIIAAVALGIAALEIAAMVVSMILYSKAGKN